MRLRRCAALHAHMTRGYERYEPCASQQRAFASRSRDTPQSTRALAIDDSGRGARGAAPQAGLARTCVHSRRILPGAVGSIHRVTTASAIPRDRCIASSGIGRSGSWATSALGADSGRDRLGLAGARLGLARTHDRAAAFAWDAVGTWIRLRRVRQREQRSNSSRVWPATQPSTAPCRRGCIVHVGSAMTSEIARAGGPQHASGSRAPALVGGEVHDQWR